MYKIKFIRPAATYSGNAELGVTTIGPGDLNCRVRNGNGCCLSGITTGLINSIYKFEILVAKLINRLAVELENKAKPSDY